MRLRRGPPGDCHLYTGPESTRPALVSTLGPPVTPAEPRRAPLPVLEVRGLTKIYSVGRFGRAKVVHALTHVDLVLEREKCSAWWASPAPARPPSPAQWLTWSAPPLGRSGSSAGPCRRGRAQRRLREHRSAGADDLPGPVHVARPSAQGPLHRLAAPAGVRRGAPPALSDEAVEQLLVQVGLVPPGEFLRRYPYQLSGGQRQRVGMAGPWPRGRPCCWPTSPPRCSTSRSRLTIMNLLLDLQRSQSLVAGLRHPRPGRGVLHERPHRHHVRRAPARNWARAGGYGRAAPPIHPAAAPGSARPGGALRRGGPVRGPRRPARPHGPPAGLPLRAALPPGAPRMPTRPCPPGAKSGLATRSAVSCTELMDTRRPKKWPAAGPQFDLPTSGGGRQVGPMQGGSLAGA